MIRQVNIFLLSDNLSDTLLFFKKELNKIYIQKLKGIFRHQTVQIHVSVEKFHPPFTKLIKSSEE